MRITGKTIFAAAATTLLTGALVTTGNPATAAAAPPDTFTKSVQSYLDNTNLDAYDGAAVWTRDGSYADQVWTFDRVATQSDGLGVYTIKNTRFGSCITATAASGKVQLAKCDPHNLAQRWTVDTAEDQTEILNKKFADTALQANGSDQAVTTEEQGDGPNNQLWTFYDK
ncbi:ricin-type beta-trefoil lectin domain protein [Streptomyces roseifaciens]|uniref:ricin-type beta-trefoil lectin domain protein n=1 Tax=Streptomyces roseifaciens TaxID=1488406 RepID=UPI000717E186|nr:ricin-type beta-trefoil lectin domain protein [Streptomyces roseifaciens]